jgi:hypothetical protein
LLGPWKMARRGLGLASGVALALLLPVAPVCADPLESLVLRGAAPTASGVVLSEAEWAAQLMDVLGLERALPEQPDEAELFGLLCAEQAELALAEGGRRLPADAAFRVAVEAPRRRAPSGPVRLTLSVPGTALYQLTAEGVGVQRWVIDGRPVGHLDLSPLGVSQGSAVVPLRAGPHEVSAYLTPDARVDRVELAAFRALCVAPADGWKGARPLRYGAMARTIVRAFDFDRTLPARKHEQLRIEGERFDEVSAGGRRSDRRLKMEASGGGWAAAVSSPAAFTWNFRLEEPRVVTVEARTHGVLPQIWSVDARYRVTLHPESVSGGFSWNHVVTVPLAAGQHALRALVSRGSGIDALRVTPRRSSDADYVAVLERLGFRGGAADEPVPRSVALDTLSRPGFRELASGFRLRMQGAPGGRPLALVDDEPDPFTTRPLSPLLPAEL